MPKNRPTATETPTPEAAAHSGTVVGRFGKITPARSEIDQPNVALVTWKRAEDGQGTILRLQEFAGRGTGASVNFLHGTIRSANLCSGVEDNLRPLSTDGHTLNLTFRPHEVLTVRVQ